MLNLLNSSRRRRKQSVKWSQSIQIGIFLEDFEFVLCIQFANYGKVKLVLENNRYFIESTFHEVLRRLLRDSVISEARIFSEPYCDGDGFTIGKTNSVLEAGPGELLNEAELVAAADEKETLSFEIDPSHVEKVKQRCLLKEPNYPI